MTNQASKVSKGLRSIGANIVKMANDSGKLEYTVKGVTKSVSLFNEEGEMLSTFDVLKEVSKNWDEMTKSEQSSLALLQAGKTQIDVYTSVLGNFDSALRANEVSLNSSGSAMAENAKYMESLEAKTTQLTKEFEKLILGDGGLQELSKVVVDTGTNILKFANSDMGELIIKTTTLVGGVSLLSLGFSALSKTTLATKLMIDATLLSSLGLSAGIKTLTATMLANPLFVGGALVAGAFAIDNAMNKANVTFEEQSDIVTELSAELKTLQSEYESLGKKTELTTADQTRLDLLHAQIEANKDIIQQEYDKASLLKAQEENDKSIFSTSSEDAKRKMNEAKSRGYGNVNDKSSALGLDVESSTIKNQITAYKELSKAKSESIEEDNEIILQKAKLIKSLSEEGLRLIQLKEDGIELSESDKERLDIIQDTIGVLGSATKSNEDYATSEEEVTDSTEEQISVLDKLVKTYNDLSSATSDIVSSLSTLSSAMNEQSENGSISAETALKLIENGYATALMFDSQTKSISINTDALNLLTESKIQAQIADLESQKIDIQTKMKEDSKVALDSAKSFLILGKSKQAGFMQDIIKTNPELIKQYNDLNKQIEVLESSVGGLGKSYTKTTSSAKSTTSALNELLKSDIQSKIDALNKSQEEEIALLEEKQSLLEMEKDARLNSIDAQINNLETLKSTTEDYYDSEIEKLKAENDALDKNNQLVEKQQNLALAKSKKVMVMGSDGKFTYGQDESAVASAEQELYDYEQQLAYDKKISDLEDLKETTISSLSAQIVALENYRNQVELNYNNQIATLSANIDAIKSKYDEQIDILENYKSNVDTFVDTLSSAEKKRIENQINAINKVNENYQTDLNNLKAYVANYNAILGSKGTSTSSVSSGGSSGTKILNAYSTGITSVPSDQMAVVGDSPELVIGSKANGVIMSLDKGSRVVDADSTKTLLNAFGSLGKYSGINGSTNGVVNNSNSNVSSSNSLIINGLTIKAENPAEFESWARGYSQSMLQTSYAN